MAEDAKPTEQPPAEQPTRKRLEKDHVRYRVLKRGHGKIHTGEITPDGPGFFSHGDEVTAHRGIAEALEDRGFAEIL